MYYILLLFCIFIAFIFESLILKLQLKILIYVLKNNYNIYWNYMQLCSVFFKSPVNVLSNLHNFKNKKYSWSFEFTELSWEHRRKALNMGLLFTMGHGVKIKGISGQCLYVGIKAICKSLLYILDWVWAQFIDRWVSQIKSSQLASLPSFFLSLIFTFFLFGATEVRLASCLFV